MIACGPGGAEPPREVSDDSAKPVVVADAAAEVRDQAQPKVAVERRPWPPTTLPLGLLATLAADEPTQSRATIRDERTGVIASYRPGDRLGPDVEVLAVQDGVVELSNDGEVEYLSVSPIPIELSADDAFYPDLLDDLNRSGSMDDAIALPPDPLYTVKAEQYSWGTPRTIARLREAIAAYARGREAPPVHIGDLSRRAGGPFPPHISHQQGRDVDIAYVMQDRGLRFARATERNLDRGLTWALVTALLDTNAVRYLFVDYEVQRLLYGQALAEGVPVDRVEALFQFPRGRRAAAGVIRHWPGHRDHFHVRFSP